ncbi:unnamed protein product [Adineta ricciae]|uniref:Uncharacterized protein n=1 Tax=Adineta ricciae TaxID=249248 RepID=A0A816FQW8_ADIRI|nr:unnamed protein product [Adineta ricciae]
MTIFLILIVFISSVHSQPVLFDIQDTLTVLCHHFPLISTYNDSSLQCSRLRLYENVSSRDSDQYNLTQLTLFIIVNQSPADSSSPVSILLNFDSLWNNSSAINEIRTGILVIHSDFIVNNQTTKVYSSNQVPIFQWKKSNPEVYNRTDLLLLNIDEYTSETSMCKWNLDRWNRLFYNQSSSESTYAHILKTTNTNLTFILTNATNGSNPSPYLTILYCIPYKLGKTEVILTIIFSIIFILFLLTLIALHYLKGADNLSRYFIRKMTSKSSTYSSYPRTSVSSTEYIE